MSSTRKRKSTAIVINDSETSDDEFDKLVRGKKRKATKDDNNTTDNDGKVTTVKTVVSKRPIRKVTTKVVSKKKQTKTVDRQSDSSNELTDEDVKLISIADNAKTEAPVGATYSSSYTNASISGTGNNSSWTDEQLLADIQRIDYTTSVNIIRLFNNDNTIPFICRYRRELIGDLSPDQLRDVKVTYNHIQNIRSKAQTILKDLKKRDILTNEIERDIQSAKSLDELEFLYSPFKAESKSTLSERAKSLGLLPVSELILHGKTKDIQFQNYIQKSVDGLDTVARITEGITHIIAHIISKDTNVRTELQRMLDQRNNGIKIQSTQSKSGSKPKANDGKSSDNKKGSSKASGNPVDNSKFENYFNFQAYVNTIQSHQVLAINRGESLKVLTVKILIPDHFQNNLLHFIRNQFFRTGHTSKTRAQILDDALNEAYNKKLKPFISRQMRSTLTKTAESASIEVFATNLRQLLLIAPVKGKKILGIDPGFINGCKVAVISECLDVLDTTVIYPHTRRQNAMDYGRQIGKMLTKHSCDLIAVGNGTACRETEAWLTELFQCDILDSKKQQYCIVNEQGASIYSCGDVAKKEFPNLDVNLISAVSIARRLSDPLAELIKVEPKHLGVGMYQHDVNEKRLLDALNEVIMECVSFVGVDVNTASATLLKHIAGLNSSRAENIVEYRMKNGSFKSRDELKKVKNIGDKTFVQCAGFIRIEPLSAGINKYNLLDSTWVHPESYQLTKKIVKKFKLSLDDIGKPAFIVEIKKHMENRTADKLHNDFNVPQERIDSVLQALSRELFRDYRADFDKQPLFKKGILKITDLKSGTAVTGAISNITSFGCFIDIGVEKDALLHISEYRGFLPKIGDRINAIVSNVEVARQRIQLKLAQ